MTLVEVVDALRERLVASGVEIAVVVPLWPAGAGDPVLVGLGDAVSVVVRPADVLGCVLRQGAPSYALIHTHPDGRPPSSADLAVTRRLVAASAVCGVSLKACLVLTETSLFDCLEPEGPSLAA